jgi:Membrane domain of glycerophosphoryl diester phosphodiesterase
MTKLSISRGWDETAAILKRDGGTLYLLAFGLGTFPQVLLHAMTPAQPGSGGQGTLALVLMFVFLVVGVIGSLAITALALGLERVVGRSLAHGARRVLPLLGATLILMLMLLVTAALLSALFGLTPENAFTGPNQLSPKAAGMVLVLLLAAVLIGARFILTTPAAAAEKGGPLAILRRSWTLTAGNYWRILGFLLLMVIAALVLILSVTFVTGIAFGAVAGPPAPGSPGALTQLLIVAAVNAVFVLAFNVLIARIYAQIVGVAQDAPVSPAEESSSSGI